MRLLHFSDVHVDMPFGRLPLASMFNKRFVGAANLVLRRGKRFALATRKLQGLADFSQALAVDGLLCTGDYTVLGTEPEYETAKAAIAPLLALDVPLVTVPGNHDVYLEDSVLERRFERYFGDFITTDCPELSGVDGWPWVRLLGPHVAAVGVNSARPNPQIWRSSGRIPDGQLAQLKNVLADERLRDRFVFVLTHYAPRRPDGTPDTKSHGMENAEELLEICRKGLVRGAILHGHIHHRLALDVDGVRVFGAGSTTDHGREGIWCFDIEAERATATPGAYLEGGYRLEPEQAIHF